MQSCYVVMIVCHDVICIMYDIGFHIIMPLEGLNFVCGALLLVFDKDEAATFDVFCALVDARMSYYTRTMCGCILDTRGQCMSCDMSCWDHVTCYANMRWGLSWCVVMFCHVHVHTQISSI